MSIIITIDDQKLDVNALSTARILELYNQLAFELDKPQVKRFATRSKAEGRLIGIADEAAQARKGKAALSEADQRQGEKVTRLAQQYGDGKPTPAPKSSPTPKAAAPAAAGAPRWARPKKEPASKIAYRPRPGSSQAKMYDLLARPEGVDIQDFCDVMKGEGIKDKTLHTPPSVWSCLRYLFVTSKGYGLSFDGQRLHLLVPADERDAGHKTKT